MQYDRISVLQFMSNKIDYSKILIYRRIPSINAIRLPMLNENCVTSNIH